MTRPLTPPPPERLDNNRKDPRKNPNFVDPNPDRVPAPNPEYSRNDYADRPEEEARPEADPKRKSITRVED
jgi:hypothetical protein